MAGAFAVFVVFWLGRQVALEFVTGYLLELSLSVDNLFLFLVIFRYFAVSEEQQHRVLTWGILGAMLMRGLFIFAWSRSSSTLSLDFLWTWRPCLSTAAYAWTFTGQHRVDPVFQSSGEAGCGVSFR